MRRAPIIAPLRHLAMVSFAVPPERVHTYIPEGFELDLRRDASGTPWALVSAVMFENHQAGPSVPMLRFLRATFAQVNYRTYVRRAGSAGAWFFKVVMGTRQADVQRSLFHAPTYSAPITLRHEWDAARRTYRTYRFDCTASPHRLSAELAGEDAQLVPGALFESAGEMTEWLTMRLDGYFHDPRGRRISSMPVRHEAMKPIAARVIGFSSEVLERLGLVPAAEQARPYAAFFQPTIDFFGEYPRRLA